jgi:hypothetical protein
LLLLLAVLPGVGGETLRPKSEHSESVALALGVSGEAKAIASKTSASLIRRQAPSDDHEPVANFLRQALDDWDSEIVSSRRGHALVRHKTSSGSRYDLWSNVTGLKGELCDHTGREDYDLKRGLEDFAAKSLVNCMQHCVDKGWCETLSFHGDPAQWTDRNVCIIVPDPCKPILGSDSMIENATDLNWITMNYTTWPEVDAMQGKHCKMSSDVQSHRLNNTEHLQDCMLQCKNFAWCTTISHSAPKQECIMVSACIAEADDSNFTGYANYQKGLVGG